MNKFFIITPVGLEDLALTELRQKFPELSPTKVKGGLELECDLTEGLKLNYMLKIPTRILLRLKQQVCRDFPKLHKIISKLPWKDFLREEQVEWVISTKKSRIINSSKAEKTANDGLKKFFNGNALSKKFLNDTPLRQKVFLRFEEDLLTVSLDTSGDMLHIRGNRPDRGHASLRENFASALLLKLSLFMNSERVDLLDPMCGTGTFLFEARDFFSPTTTRQYIFNQWPSQASFEIPCPLERKLFDKLQGLDKDQVFPAKDTLNIAFSQNDLFIEPPHLSKKTALICNPPYGKRIKIKGKREDYFKKLLDIIEKELSPSGYGIIIPQEIPLEHKFQEKFAFNNNGIKVNFCLSKPGQ